MSGKRAKILRQIAGKLAQSGSTTAARGAAYSQLCLIFERHWRKLPARDRHPKRAGRALLASARAAGDIG